MWPCHNCYNNLLPLTLQTLYTVRQFCVCVVWRNNGWLSVLLSGWLHSDHLKGHAHLSITAFRKKSISNLYQISIFFLSTKRKKTQFYGIPMCCYSTEQHGTKMCLFVIQKTTLFKVIQCNSSDKIKTLIGIQCTLFQNKNKK